MQHGNHFVRGAVAPPFTCNATRLRAPKVAAPPRRRLTGAWIQRFVDRRTD